MVKADNSDVSVVILTKNSARTIGKCLESVLQERPKEILAVDRLSRDGTLDILEDYNVGILTDSMGSLGYSRQLAVDSARGTYVMFVDSDAELCKGCISTLRYELIRNNWAGIHAMLLSTDNLSYWQKSENEKFSLTFNRPGPSKSIGTIAALFRRDLLVKYPFDANLAEAAEDIDVCLRLRKCGYAVGISSAIAYHHHRQELSAFIRQRFNYGLGDAKLGVKHRSTEMLINPLRSGVFYAIYSLVTNRARLIPFWLTGAIVQFAGVIVGVSRARSRFPST
jgi:glycosyltransferase involved in cell wall biosynthesis